MWRYALGIASIGILAQIVVASEGGDATSGGLFVLALFFYMAAAALATYAHLYVGPRSVRPWEATKEDILDDEMRTRADDRARAPRGLWRSFETAPTPQE